MAAPPNLYAAIVFKLNPRIKAYLDQLDQTGQIDRDQNGHPYLVKVDPNGNSNWTVHIIRNGQMANFIINTRKKSEPITSWNPNDGYVRPESKASQVVTDEPDEGKRKERARQTFEGYRNLVDQIVRG